jgi:hypothetical protein
MSFCAQVIKFSLRPLYDPVIPLESFATAAQAAAFRDALRTTTEASWAKAKSCQSNCTTGFCRSTLDTDMTVNYQCELPGTVDTGGSMPLRKAPAFQIERKPLGLGDAPVVPGLAFLQLGVNSFLGLPPHEQYGTHMRNKGRMGQACRWPWVHVGGSQLMLFLGGACLCCWPLPCSVRAS